MCSERAWTHCPYLQHSHHGSPKPLRNPYERSTSQTALDKELPALPSRPTLRRPVSDRSLSATSCELRNPFRSDTSDSVTTVSMSRASSFVEAVTPVQRTVLKQFPEQIEGTMDHLPHKAAIFTIPAHGLGISSGDSSGTEHSVLSAMLTASSTGSVADVAEVRHFLRPHVRYTQFGDVHTVDIICGRLQGRSHLNAAAGRS